MNTFREVMRLFPLAVRKDYGGFILVAFEEKSGFWRGRAWRSSDWKSFDVDVTGVSSDDVFSQYRVKISVLRDLAGVPVT